MTPWPALADLNNPASPDAPAAAPRYGSVFSAYRGIGDDDAAPDAGWRDANDLVGRLGGHMGHVRGESKAAAQPRPQAPVPSRSAAQPSGGHAGHASGPHGAHQHGKDQ